MTNILTVPLEGCVPGGANIEILRAEMRTDVASFLALIRYSEHGMEPQYGIRLDLDKKVFIDHLEDVQQEQVMQQAAPKLAAILNDVRREIYYQQEVARHAAPAYNAVSRINVEVEQTTGQIVASVTAATNTSIIPGYVFQDIAANGSSKDGRTDGSIPGVQTGGHAIEVSGATDMRGISDLLNEAIESR